MEFTDISDDCTASIFMIKGQADQANSLLLESWVLGLLIHEVDAECSSEIWVNI
jgi:hypothetical protein